MCDVEEVKMQCVVAQRTMRMVVGRRTGIDPLGLFRD
jgi:hypothetical protein